MFDVGIETCCGVENVFFNANYGADYFRLAEKYCGSNGEIDGLSNGFVAEVCGIWFDETGEGISFGGIKVVDEIF